MRNQEAARYARWAATAAGVITLVAVGLYVERAIREARLRRGEPMAISVGIQQQSAEFTFSKVEQDRTIFTIRASKATQFKDEDRAVLKDVWISIYGTKGEQNDSIHTGECSYEPKTGDVRCQGDVEIDIQNAAPAGGKALENSQASQMKVITRDLSFNRESGEAHTDQPVTYVLPQGSGQAVGLSYNTKDSIVRLEHDVELKMAPSERSGGLPITAQGSSLEIERNNLLVILNGPAKVTEGPRELTAATLTFELDAQYHVKHAMATGSPTIRSTENGAETMATAEEFEGYLSPAGWIERLSGSGNVQGTRKGGGAADHLSAEHVNFTMLPEKNLIQEMEASGKVRLESKGPDGTRQLETEALKAAFSTDTSRGQTEQQRILSAETLSPATIETTNGPEETVLAADRFQAKFAPDGRFEKLLGHSHVRITRQLGAALPQTSTADEMEAKFAKGGEWDALEQTGDVQFHQGERGATAAKAEIVRSTNLIDLSGSPVLTDEQSRTTAGNVTINQATGDLKAIGGVVTTFAETSQAGPMGLGSGDAHVSADTLSGSTKSGHVVYSGHARLWQGESVLDADQIEVWREDQKLRAAGHVAAVFPQTSAPGTGGTAGGAGNLQSIAEKGPGTGVPTLWKITAPVLTYWGQEGKAHLEGGVAARSEQGTIRSKTMDVYFTPAGAAGQRSTGSRPQARQFSRVVALGGVTVTQGDRRGTGQEAEYTASDGKFVLSGGNPTVSDGSGNTTVGRSLTFFVANDTILIDSQEGSRTLTKHRVEK
ncbi:MAG TPA: LPS export ABC transporter periplasmic protein LptC [Verrucomicrobiae bacterium]|nr:LPS export ABC transporter periplasmic protein LptC [Verrucomicrobiae bacterium]